MRESDLLSHVYARSADLARAFPAVLVGPGDDCAVVRAPSGSGELLLKVDQVVEGRHFEPHPATPVELIARKALARAVSDVAAMAGTPLAALCAAAIPNACRYANDLFDACAGWARRFGCPLVGGDIAATPGPLTLSVTVIATPHAARGPVLRSTARPGDLVCVTGAIGSSRDRATGLGHHLTFEPRVREAAWLADTLGPRLTAMMDISDGLGIDAARLARASGVALVIDADRIPLRAAGTNPLDAIAAGEDYELLFCCAGTPPAAVPGAAVQNAGTPVTVIGTIQPGTGCRLRPAGSRDVGKPEGEHGDIDIANLGWDHGAS